MKRVFSAPSYLLPLKKFHDTWPVIACDQHSSNIQYWQKVKSEIGISVSTMKLIIPEVYYSKNIDWSKALKVLNRTAIRYLNKQYLNPYDEGIILVKRTTESGNRLGVLLLLDLEEYDFNEGTDACVKATERTNIERVVKRKSLRSSSCIELSHTIILFDDLEDKLLRSYRSSDKFSETIYDVKLKKGGGHVSSIPLKNKNTVLYYFNDLLNNKRSKFYVGDGNHSLASAKEHWNEIKTTFNKDEQIIHPLRYYLVEMINIHDLAVNFYPIHRIIYPVTAKFLNYILNLNTGTNRICIYYQGQKYNIFLDDDAISNYKFIDHILLKEKLKVDGIIDFIHEEEEVIKLSNKFDRCLGIVMTTFNKNSFFELLEKHTILPAKSFSIGHSHEKRYYFECRSLDLSNSFKVK